MIVTKCTHSQRMKVASRKLSKHYNLLSYKKIGNVLKLKFKIKKLKLIDIKDEFFERDFLELFKWNR